jgi:hypothetical protein
MAEADDDESFFLGQDGLINGPSRVKVWQQVRHPRCGEFEALLLRKMEVVGRRPLDFTSPSPDNRLGAAKALNSRAPPALLTIESNCGILSTPKKNLDKS